MAVDSTETSGRCFVGFLALVGIGLLLTGGFAFIMPYNEIQSRVEFQLEAILPSSPILNVSCLTLPGITCLEITYRTGILFEKKEYQYNSFGPKYFLVTDLASQLNFVNEVAGKCGGLWFDPHHPGSTMNRSKGAIGELLQNSSIYCFVFGGMLTFLTLVHSLSSYRWKK